MVNVYLFLIWWYCCSVSNPIVAWQPTTHHRLARLNAVDAKNTRAGDQGYSVLRQPVRWDTDSDPFFEAPSSEKARETDLSSWWTDRTDGSNGETKSNTFGDALPNDKDDRWTVRPEEENEEVDIYQRTLETLDIPKIQRALYYECTTVCGRQMVNHAVADTAEACRETYAAIQEYEQTLMSNLKYKNRISYQTSISSNPIRHSFPLEVLLQDEEEILQGDELTMIATMLDQMEDITYWRSALAREESFPVLIKLTHDLYVNETLQELLHSAFEEQDNRQQRLNGETFVAVGEYRRQIRALKRTILATVENLLPNVKLALESGGSPISEINGHLVIPVSADYSHIGIVHDQSRSGKTLFVEPHQVVSDTVTLKGLQVSLQKEELKAWRYLTAQVYANREQLRTNLRCIGHLDLTMARFALGEKLSGVIPTVSDEGIIDVKNAKHPVLLLRNLPNVVGSDVSLGSNGNQGLVLTGPNAGGKTVILKLLGVFALMVRYGIPVPADNKDAIPRVDFFDPVLADIGDLQSVGGDLSTFSGHMLVCKQVLENSGRNALILMDELGSGTDPNQGVAIAQALLEAVVDAGARVAITTHYMQLKLLAAVDDRFAVGGMQFVKGKPTYRLLPGTVGESFALSVAERLGLPQSVLDRANVLLDSETRKMGDLLRDLEDQKVLVDEQAEALERQKQDMARLQREMEEERIRLEKKQLDARRNEARKFAKQLEEKEEVLEDVLRKLKSDPSRRILAKSWQDIKIVKRDVLEEAENVPSVVASKKKKQNELEAVVNDLTPIADLLEPPDVKPGDIVIVCKKGPLFGKEAIVSGFSGKAILLKVNNMNMSLKTKDVALTHSGYSGGAQTPKKKSARERSVEKALAEEFIEKKQKGAETPKARSKVIIRTPSNTVDVLGCNFAAAQEKIRSKMSSVLMSNSPVMFVLHGHGSGGVLKSKIRAWLKSESMVESFRPADATDGGDALTCVILA